jgi:hypothetical protein
VVDRKSTISDPLIDCPLVHIVVTLMQDLF